MVLVTLRRFCYLSGHRKLSSLSSLKTVFLYLPVSRIETGRVRLLNVQGRKGERTLSRGG